MVETKAESRSLQEEHMVAALGEITTHSTTHTHTECHVVSCDHMTSTLTS